MATKPKTDRQLDETEAKVHVFGWAVVQVQAIGDRPEFAYTVGLTEQTQSELVIVGLDPKVALDALNVACSAVVGGQPFELGQKYNGLLGKNEVLIHEADIKFTPPGIARSFYPDRVSLWAMLWPDSEDRWPWYEGARNTGQMSPDFLEAARVKFNEGSEESK